MLTVGEVLDATGGQLKGAQASALDARFSRVVVDSRSVPRGALFVALKGQQHDGHDFVARAVADGAAGALVERVPADCGWALDPAADGPPLIVVGSTPGALATMARYVLDRYPGLDVVGITGSLGKTTTKEVVAGVLGARRRVLKTEGNLNSEIGLPMTVLNGLDTDYEIAVLEMAMYEVGDIRLLARLARPRVGVVTAVLPVHLERLGTIERIQQAKQELVEELPSNGVAVLNADDLRVDQMASATPARVVRYGVSEHADVRADNIQSHGLRGVEFDLLNRGQRQRVHLPLLGAHSVQAALAATAVALEERFTLAEAAAALHGLSPTLRLLVVEGINGSRIVDDSYNASPESVLAALNLLHELPGRRKIGVLGDMLELGSEEDPGHRRVGNRAAAVLDLLIAYGPRSKITADEARRAGLSREQVLEPHSHAEIVDFLTAHLRPGDDVLVKGSLAMGMSAVVRGIRAQGESYVATALSMAAMAFLITIVLGYPYLNYLRRSGLGKKVRSEGPSTHIEKTGTPTMGGLLVTAVVLALTVCLTLILYRENGRSILLPMAVMALTTLLGWYDDRLTLVGRKGQGMQARTKFAALGLVALAASFVLWDRPTGLGIDFVYLPGVKAPFVIGWWVIPLSLLAIMGTSHAVNLTDGLDSLAGHTAAVAYAAYGIIAAQYGQIYLVTFCFTVAGALLAFLWFNAHPAEVFMGDSGSLALGATLAIVAMMLGQVLLLLFIGFVFVAEALSVMLQVVFFKLTGGRRLFRMAPLHHHFEMMGWSETQVAQRFWLISMVSGLLGVALALV